jgi:hypothetical protein
MPSAIGGLWFSVVGRLTNNQTYYYVTRLRRVLQIPKIKNSPPLFDLSASGGSPDQQPYMISPAVVGRQTAKHRLV